MTDKIKCIFDEDWAIEVSEKQYENARYEAEVSQNKASKLMEEAGQKKQQLIDNLEYLFDSDYNMKYKCPKCGHEMEVNCGWEDDQEIYRVACGGCGYVGTGTFIHRLAALLDWFDKCKHKEDKDE